MWVALSGLPWKCAMQFKYWFPNDFCDFYKIFFYRHYCFLPTVPWHSLFLGRCYNKNKSIHVSRRLLVWKTCFWWRKFTITIYYRLRYFSLWVSLNWRKIGFRRNHWGNFSIKLVGYILLLSLPNCLILSQIDVSWLS